MSRWPVTELGDLISFRGGGTPSKDKPEYWGNDISWATVKDFKGLYLDKTRDSISEQGLKSSSANLIPAGHVIIPTRMALGKAAINTIDLAINQDLRALLPQKPLDTKYLLYSILGLSDQIEKNSSGATVKGITQEKLKKLRVPYPPLKEQKRIAKILDAADALRAKRRESLAQLDALLQSVFLDLFGDPDSNGWEWSVVEDVAEKRKGAIRTGPFGSQLLHSEFVDSGVPVLGIDNVVSNEFREGKPRFVTNDKYERLKRYTVSPGDVLITIMGTCGRCAIVPEGMGVAINTKHLCCISLDRRFCLPEFMHAYFLRHPTARHYLEDNAKGAIMSGLNMGIIKELPIPLPPIGLQDKFAKFVQYSKRQKAKLLKHNQELTCLFASLQQRAFSGEL